MAARAYWSGQIRLALVSIPVQIFSATKSTGGISFHQIHEPSGKRVRYQKVVPGIGPIDPDEIVKGYEVDKDKYVLLSDEEIDEIKLEAKKTIELVQFVDQKDIDPIYFDRPFFVAPDEDLAEEAYVVLRKALKDTGKIGLGQLVVRGKSHIVAVKPCGRGLLMETLRYPEEIRKSDAFFSDIPDIEPDEELVDLAEELIGRKAGPFRPEAFEDAYKTAVKELIEAKLEDRPPEEIEAPEGGAAVIDLMEALKRSVGKSQKGQKSGGKSSAKSRGAAAPSGKSSSKSGKSGKSKPKSAKGKKAA